jgi:hypothetical protein
MKRLLFFCIMLLLTFSQFGCNRLAGDSNGNSLYMQYLVQSQNHDALLVNIAYTEKAEIGYVEQYYRLDLQNYNTETISYLEGKQLNLLKSKYEAFDIDNFIATNAPDNDPHETEIGLFHNSYIPLIKDSSARVEYDSVQDNICIYCLDKDGMINDSVHIMNRDGTNKTSVPLGIEAVVTEYFRLTPKIGCINAYNAGPEKLSISALINFETEQVKLFMESGKDYDIEGVLNNAVLIKESDIQANTNRFFLVNADGTEESDLFHITVKDVYESQYSLMDIQGNRFFYGYIGLDNYFSVCCFNFSTMKLSTILPGKNNADNIESESTLSLFLAPFYIIQESDTLSFILSCVDGNEVWYLINLETEEVESIVLPKDTDTTLSTDGKYVLCANIKGRSKKNAIIAFDTQTYTPFSEKLDLRYERAFYNPVMQEFILPLKYDVDGNTLYKVNANGEVTKFYIDK